MLEWSPAPVDQSQRSRLTRSRGEPGSACAEMAMSECLNACKGVIMTLSEPCPAERSPTFLPPKLLEIWGDGPLFPGPSWRLHWDLAEAQQRLIWDRLRRGELWTSLQTFSPLLAKLEAPWQAGYEVEQELSFSLLILGAIVDLARLLIRPARLDVCTPRGAVRLRTACLVLESNQHEIAGQALRISAQLIHTAHQYERGDWSEEQRKACTHQLNQLADRVEICCRHPLTMALLDEARKRQISAFLLDPAQRLYQLGTGEHGRWFSSTSNDRDSAFGVAIARDKSHTHNLLSQLGLPLPREVCLSCQISDAQLLTTAAEFGYPCVLKPLDCEQGFGVTANIRDSTALLAAFGKVKALGRRRMLLQEHVPGADYRLNVIDGEIAFAVKRSVPKIIGNGMSTVLELIDDENSLRRKRRRAGFISAEIDPADQEVRDWIAAAGLDIDRVPRKGDIIPLRGNANVSTGGSREDVDVADIHPIVKRHCAAIAKTLCLDNCGIDYLSEDISMSPLDSHGTYLEVNSMPQNADSRVGLLLNNLYPEGKCHSVSTRTVVVDPESVSIQAMDAVLGRLIEQNPLALVGIPLWLRQAFSPLLSDDLKNLTHFYQHPREIMLRRSTTYAIYVTTPRELLLKGLPAGDATSIIWMVPPATLEPSHVWRNFCARVSQK